MLHTKESNKFCAKYFPGNAGHITKAMLERIMKKEDKSDNSQQGRIQVKNDDDYFTIEMVYFINCYLMGNEPSGKIPLEYFDAVYSRNYTKAIWGYLSFRETINSLRSNGRRATRPTSFMINGFPMVLQVWFYEVCGAFEGVVCERIIAKGF